MNTLSRSFAFPSLITLLCLSACGSQTGLDAAVLDSRIPGNAGQIGRLGLGFDPLTQEFRSAACVTGDVIEMGSEEAGLNYLQDLDVAALTKRMGMTLGWSNPLLAVSPELEFLQESSSTSLSNAYSILFELKGKATEIASETLRLTEGLQSRASLSPAEVFSQCGEEYVSRMEYGAALLATLKVEFGNHNDKREFAAKAELQFPGSPGTGLFSGSFNRLSEGLRQRTRVVVSARQFGGNPSALLQILPAGVAKCTLDDLEPCIRLFENIAQYSAGLSEQFEGPADYVATAYETRRYDEQALLADTLSWPSFSAESKRSLGELAQTLAARSFDKGRADYLLGAHGPSLSAMRRAQTEALAQGLAKDISRLERAIEVCAKSALSQSGTVSNDCATPALTSYSRQALEAPFADLLFLSRFDSSRPLEGFTIRPSNERVSRTEHQAERQNLNLLLESNRPWSCDAAESVSLSLPITVEVEGLYTLQSELSLSACLDCLATAALTFDDAAFAAPRNEISRQPGRPSTLRKTLRLTPGQHMVGVRLESTYICKGQSAKLSLSSFKVEKITEPFARFANR